MVKRAVTFGYTLGLRLRVNSHVTMEMLRLQRLLLRAWRGGFGCRLGPAPLPARVLYPT